MKQMNNEPVAWGMLDKDGGIYDSISPEEHDREEGAYTIPLYTHPADRIAELEKQIENLKWDVNHREQDIDNLKTRLFDAKRKYDTSTHEYKYSAKYVKELEAKIAELAQSNPLYTHPAKTLTDEEIIEITIRWFGSRRNDFFPEQWLDFARAILKKASEK